MFAGVFKHTTTSKVLPLFFFFELNIGSNQKISKYKLEGSFLSDSGFLSLIKRQQARNTVLSSKYTQDSQSPVCSLMSATGAPAATATSSQRRAASVAIPATAVRLARDFRPTKTHSNLTRRSDGRYNEPYSAIVERDDEVSILCVQRTTYHQVLVRHMPEREWQRIVRHGDEVYPGQEGESSLHVVAAPELSTLPRSFQTETHAAATTTTFTVNNTVVTAITPATAAVTTEPAVFDYFVAPESRVGQIHAGRKSSTFTALRLRARYSKSDLQRVAREDCRAMLSVERRNIFLRQYQRDMQCRMSGVSLYTVGKELPENFVQTFFMLVENAQALRRHQARLDATNAGTQSQAQQRANSNGNNRANAGGRYLFTLDQACTNCGERLPFAGQAPADGFVVVTVGPTADAFTSAWHPRNVDGGRFAWMYDNDEDDNKPFVPYDYGSAEYLPRPTKRNSLTRTVTVDGVEGSSPLLPRFPARRASKRVSNLSSHDSVSSPLGLSRSTPSLFCTAQVDGARSRKVRQGGSNKTEEGSDPTRTPSPMRLPLSSDEGDDETSGDVLSSAALQVPVQVA